MTQVIYDPDGLAIQGMIEDDVDGFVANEANTISEYLLNAGSQNQNVDGSVTPVVFSSTPVPAGKKLLVSRIIIYMEDGTAFSSNLFGGLAALTNGWTFEINGGEIFSAKTNRELISYMFDGHGSEIFGKITQTLIGRLSFNKYSGGASGLTVTEGNTFDSIVSDDLSGLVYLEARIQGVLKDA